MPSLNKNHLTRLLFLDKCFQEENMYYNIDDLLAKLEVNGFPVSKRTLYDDINYIKSEEGFGMEFVNKKEYGRTIYRYAEPEKSMFNKLLTDGDMFAINDLLSALNMFRGMPHLDWTAKMCDKLEEVLRGEQAYDNKEKPIMGFDQNVDLKGINELLPTLFNYIKAKQTLKIKYTTFTDKTFVWIIHPYYLKQYNNRWFLLGLNKYGKLSNLAIDRIESVAADTTPYIPNTEIDFDDYFYDVIGVSFDPKQPDISNVELLFDEERWPYVRTKPMHPSQREIRERTIQLKVRINNELVTQILSFGNQVTVLAPEKLRDTIKSIYSKALENYKYE